MANNEFDEYAKYGPFGKAVMERQREIESKLTLGQRLEIERKQNEILEGVQKQIALNTRPKPSNNLVSTDPYTSISVQRLAVDVAAFRADRVGLVGRSDQCVAFAVFLRAILQQIGIEADVHIGRAFYKRSGSEPEFDLFHAWVSYGNIIIDANTDSFYENPTIPSDIRPLPYWGKRSLLRDRRYITDRLLLKDREPIEVHEDIESEKWRVANAFLIGKKSL